MRHVTLHPRIGVVNRLLQKPKALRLAVRTSAHDHRVGKDIVERCAVLGGNLTVPVAVVRLYANRQGSPVHARLLRIGDELGEDLVGAERPFASVVFQHPATDAARLLAFGGHFGSHAASEVYVPVSDRDAASRALLLENVVHAGEPVAEVCLLNRRRRLGGMCGNRGACRAQDNEFSALDVHGGFLWSAATSAADPVRMLSGFQ